MRATWWTWGHTAESSRPCPAAGGADLGGLRRQNVRRVGLALDLLASLAVVAVTVTAMVQFVRLA